MEFGKYNLQKEKELQEYHESKIKELRYLGKEGRETKEKYEEIKKAIEKIRYIVGFGRGYFAGDDYQKYLMEKDGEYYFWIRHYDEVNETVGIYRLKNEARELYINFLRENTMEDGIEELEEILKKTSFYKLHHALENERFYEKIGLNEFYGLKIEELEEDYISEYQPRNSGTEYPFKVFDEEYHREAAKLEKKIKKMNASEKIILVENKQLYIKIGNEKYKLEKTR